MFDAVLRTSLLQSSFSVHDLELGFWKEKCERRSTLRVKCATYLNFFFAVLLNRFSVVEPQYHKGLKMKCNKHCVTVLYMPIIVKSSVRCDPKV